jgi:hypothetical protein
VWGDRRVQSIGIMVIVLRSVRAGAMRGSRAALGSGVLSER